MKNSQRARIDGEAGWSMIPDGAKAAQVGVRNLVVHERPPDVNEFRIRKQLTLFALNQARQFEFPQNARLTDVIPARHFAIGLHI